MIPTNYIMPEVLNESQVTLPRRIDTTPTMLDAWRQFTTNNREKLFYRTWIDVPAFLQRNEIDIHLLKMSDSEICARFAGWWLRKITSYFMDRYIAISALDMDSRDPIIKTKSIEATQSMIDDANRMLSEIADASDWLHRNHQSADGTVLKKFTIMWQYLWWRHQHLLLLRHDLKLRYEMEHCQLYALFEDGQMPWQSEWEVDAEMRAKISIATTILPSSDIESSDIESTESDNSLKG